MAHFYGSIQGHRGEASRLGSRSSGLVVKAASWQGAVYVSCNVNGDTDNVTIEFIPWHGKGSRRVIYSGPISGKVE